LKQICPKIAKKILNICFFPCITLNFVIGLTTLIKAQIRPLLA